MAASGLASAQPASQKLALYANVGADLTHYDVDFAAAELIKRETVTLPAAVQYAWPHASRRYLYVASSSSAPGYGTQGTDHHVTALAIDPSTGGARACAAPSSRWHQRLRRRGEAAHPPAGGCRSRFRQR
jgi:6-phosphogluconolactonase